MIRVANLTVQIQGHFQTALNEAEEDSVRESSRATFYRVLIDSLSEQIFSRQVLKKLK